MFLICSNILRNGKFGTIREKAEEHGPNSHDFLREGQAPRQDISSFSNHSPNRRGPFKSEIIRKKTGPSLSNREHVSREYNLKSDISRPEPSPPFSQHKDITFERNNHETSPQRISQKKELQSRGIFDASQGTMLLQTKSQEFCGVKGLGERLEGKGIFASGREIDLEDRTMRSNSGGFEVSADNNVIMEEDPFMSKRFGPIIL